MKLNTWGISKHPRNIVNFDPNDHRYIEEVRLHLGLTLIEIKGDGQPVQVALGEPGNQADPDAATQHVTPFFSSFEALDYFCQLNLSRYLAFDPRCGLPRRWFWSQADNTLRPTGLHLVNQSRQARSPIPGSDF
ncbi:MAG: hypothetical protein ACRBC3_15895 [Burkholderiaceae bacterium]